MIGPADFAPFREEIDLCECATCRATGPAARTVLLAMLRANTHRRMTLAERAAEAREEKAERLTHLRASGASRAYIEAVERGYVKYSGFMRDGIGAGLTPGGVGLQ